MTGSLVFRKTTPSGTLQLLELWTMGLLDSPQIFCPAWLFLKPGLSAAVSQDMVPEKTNNYFSGSFLVEFKEPSGHSQ